MPTRKIYCSGCQLFLGEIHKASLRKNISHLCENCENKRYNTKKPDKTYDDTSIFDDIFGKDFKF